MRRTRGSDDGRTVELPELRRPVYMLVNCATGKRAPIDAPSSEDGNIVFEEGGRYRVLSKGEVATRPRHLNHFVTCPHARSWARKSERR